MWDFLFKSSQSGESGDGERVSLDVIDPRDIDSHCLISGNLQIRGDVLFSGTLRVDGRIDGKVSVYEGGRGQLIVSRGAVINGPVNVTTALVDGTVTGPMDIVGKLECRPHAVLKGDVLYGKINITDGARIEARCRQREGRASHVTDVRDATKSGSINFLATKKPKKP